MLCARSMSIHTRRVPQWFARRSGGHTAAESFRAHAAAQSRGLPRWLEGAGQGNGAGIPTDLDAIIVLGGGQDVDAEHRLPPWVERRLDTAADLQALQTDRTCRILLSGGGTPHKPPIIAANGFCETESMTCAAYLHNQGVPTSLLLRESASFDTIGNAFFSATMHAVPCAWRRVAVVTSAFHMPRTQAIHDKVFRLVDASLQRETQLVYAAASDEGALPEDVLSARIEREARSTARFVEDAKALRTLQDFHEWMMTTHLCYAVPRQEELFRPDATAGPVLASY